MKRVVIESPLAPTVSDGKVISSQERHKAYAKLCVRDSLRRGEAPYASHLFYDQEGILDDRIDVERELGIVAGLAWGQAGELRALYVDLGVSSGMERGRAAAVYLDQEIVVRRLPDDLAAQFWDRWPVGT